MLSVLSVLYEAFVWAARRPPCLCHDGLDVALQLCFLSLNLMAIVASVCVCVVAGMPNYRVIWWSFCLLACLLIRMSVHACTKTCPSVRPPPCLPACLLGGGGWEGVRACMCVHVRMCVCEYVSVHPYIHTSICACHMIVDGYAFVHLFFISYGVCSFICPY